MADGPAAESTHAQLKRLFLEICDLPDDAARRARLAELDAPPALADRALAMAAPSGAGTTQLRRPVAGMLASVAQADGTELQVGDRLGAWTLVGELGAGGMGMVFGAERSDGHYRQRAAIKLMRGWAGPEALARVARERQILAGLAHPHIARLLDGGSTPLGRPYLVMELVEGVPIDAHCRDAGLGLAARLALFDQVCDAVGHAHRQLVVHCDLKPSNILVTAEGRVMLLDFGIARLTGEGQPGAEGAAALTPRYASPEQQEGRPLGSATDLYSLGCVLAELLQDCPGAASRRREWQAIVDRATAEDPAQRYDSAQALADDLRRLRAHRPLRALPPRWTYVGAKLLRRRWPWALVAGGGVVLVAGFTLRLLHERDRALTEAQAAHQAGEYVVSLFKAADPMEGGRPDLPVGTLVDRGRERIERELRGQPGLQARMFVALAEAYDHIGRDKDALPLAQRAAELLARSGPPMAEARALTVLARLQRVGGQGEAALASAQRSLALREAHGDADGFDLADGHHTLLLVYSDLNRMAEAEHHGRIALAGLQRDPVHNAEQLAVLEANFGRLYLFAGDPERAEPHYRAALALRRQIDGPGHARTLTTATGLAAVLHDLRQLDEAAAQLTEVVRIRQQLHGRISQHVVQPLRELALVHLDAGRHDAALAAIGEVLAVDLQASGNGSGSYLYSQSVLAAILGARGDLATADRLYAETVQRREAKAMSPAPTLRLRRDWARLHWEVGDADRAAAVLAPALQASAARPASAARERLELQLVAAELALARGDTAPAVAALEAAAPGLATQSKPVQAQVHRLRGLLARQRGDTGLDDFERAWTLASARWADTDRRLWPYRLHRAESLLAAGRPDAAAPLLQALRRDAAGLPAGSRLRQQIERVLARS